MTHLRKRMTGELQLRGPGALTQHRYVHAVQQPAEHHGKSPDTITEEELRDYFLPNYENRRKARILYCRRFPPLSVEL